LFGDDGFVQNTLRPTAAVQLDAQLRARKPLSTSLLGRRLTARVLHIPRGPFDAGAMVEDPHEWLGLLVLDGLIAVGLDAGRAHTTWLVGADDLIRPWDMGELSLIRDPGWRAVTSTRVALLDADFSRRVAGIPTITRELITRATQTTHWLLAKSLIAGSPVVEERLLLLFALLSERWGRVRPDGVCLDLPLTHDLLAKMCGARRPSVTTALRSLRERGLVDYSHRGCWLLRGDFACGELASLTDLRDWRGDPVGVGVDGALEAGAASSSLVA
jgi:CRP-like cAMP-binding protein